MELQHFHMRKHEIVAQAKREFREEMKNRERATHDMHHMSGSGGYGAAGATGESKGDVGRRAQGPGNIFSWAFPGGRGGDRGSRPQVNTMTGQQRKAVASNTLNDHYIM